MSGKRRKKSPLQVSNKEKRELKKYKRRSGSSVQQKLFGEGSRSGGGANRKKADTVNSSNEDDDNAATRESAFCITPGPPPICWTEKYRPNCNQSYSSNTSIFIGNENAVQQAKQWLIEWKHVGRTAETDYSSDSEVSKDDGKVMNSCLVIVGPPGVGKTSLVYYIASQLEYRVFEVNASCDRPGKKILGDLKEAIQSQHMRKTHASIFGTLPATVTSSPRICALEAKMQERINEAKAKEKEKTTVKNTRGTLLSFFNIKNGSKASDAKPETHSTESVEKIKGRRGNRKNEDDVVILNSSIEEEGCVVQSSSESEESKKEAEMEYKCSERAITLFDDVDVVFDDEQDDGFWNAIPQLLQLSRKPIIFTCTHSDSVLPNFPAGCTTVLQLRRPKTSDVVDHLANILRQSHENDSELCHMSDKDDGLDKVEKTQNVSSDASDQVKTSTHEYLISNLRFYANYFANDIRRLLTELQFGNAFLGLREPSRPDSRIFDGSGIFSLSKNEQRYRQFGFTMIYSCILGSIYKSCEKSSAFRSLQKQTEVNTELKNDCDIFNEAIAIGSDKSEDSDSFEMFLTDQRASKLKSPSKTQKVTWSKCSASDSKALDEIASFLDINSWSNGHLGQSVDIMLPSERRFRDLMLIPTDSESSYNPLIEEVNAITLSSAALRLVSSIKDRVKATNGCAMPLEESSVNNTCNVETNIMKDKKTAQLSWLKSFEFSDHELLRINDLIKDERRCYKLNSIVRDSEIVRPSAEKLQMLDCTSAVRTICQLEKERKRETGFGRGRRQRFLHYLTLTALDQDLLTKYWLCSAASSEYFFDI